MNSVGIQASNLSMRSVMMGTLIDTMDVIIVRLKAVSSAHKLKMNSHYWLQGTFHNLDEEN
jgi:hypothetical protein